ncbi:Growth/differentiation factor 11 [Operophtera brumata]|uniref:Growth/differentiation factor 11 n=1 Tax=Operophtera brumata TaxID=104452 RepID=A0A0L7LD97_OPEBR|nr:Growth/differentiation factor 11 [Operophtera brumata]
MLLFSPTGTKSLTAVVIKVFTIIVLVLLAHYGQYNKIVLTPDLVLGFLFRGCREKIRSIACTSCRSNDIARERSLRLIRESLLAKLSFKQAPNTTGRELPHVPADLMEMFESKKVQKKPPREVGVQADAPASSRTLVTHIEQDDFLAQADNVLIFAR